MKTTNRNIKFNDMAKGIFGCDWRDNVYLELSNTII